MVVPVDRTVCVVCSYMLHSKYFLVFCNLPRGAILLLFVVFCFLHSFVLFFLYIVVVIVAIILRSTCVCRVCPCCKAEPAVLILMTM